MNWSGGISDALGSDAPSIDRLILAAIKHRVQLGGKAGSADPVRASASIRDLLRHHSGTVSPRAIVQIWSNIFYWSGRETLHVFSGENAHGFRDLARIHFGAVAPMTSHASAAAVVHACAGDASAIGIVPVPESEENRHAWWEQLAPTGSAGPRIVQSLPLVCDDACEVALPRGYAIASVEQSAVGIETTVLRFECAGELSRTRFQSLLQQAGFDSHVLSSSRGASNGGFTRILVATKGYVAADDERIASMAALTGDAIAGVALVGGFVDPSGATTA